MLGSTPSDPSSCHQLRVPFVGLPSTFSCANQIYQFGVQHWCRILYHQILEVYPMYFILGSILKSLVQRLA